MLNSADRNIVLKGKLIWSVDVILQKLFDISHFKGLKFCILRRTANTLAVHNNFRGDCLFSPERMVASGASTVTNTDVTFAPSACGAVDGLAAVWAVDWHLLFRGVNDREMDQPLQLPCFPLLRVLYAVRLPGLLQGLLGPSQGVQSAKTASLINALTVWSSILRPTRTPELVISSYLPGKNWLMRAPALRASRCWFAEQTRSQVVAVLVAVMNLRCGCHLWRAQNIAPRQGLGNGYACFFWLRVQTPCYHSKVTL